MRHLAGFAIQSCPYGRASDTSRDKRIPGRITKDPEEDQESKPGPEIKRGNENSALRPPSDGAFRKPQQAIDDKRQGQQEQGIQLESGDWM